MKCMDCKNRSALPNETCALCYNCDRYERKPLTNADRIRAMTDEEIEKWFWWMHKEMMRYTDSRVFVHDWLRQEAGE